jgi:hypothetical protein
MNSSLLNEQENDAHNDYVPVYRLIDKLETYLQSKATMPGLDERLQLAAAKAIAEGRKTMTRITEAEWEAHVQSRRPSASVPLYLVAAE